MFSYVKESKIKGLYEITPKILSDERGVFIKTYHKEFFKEKEFEFSLSEQYFSISKNNVVRGMHFQLPPHAHSKIVYCIMGSIIDVILDLRKGSPTYGQYESYELTSYKHNILYIPVGLAHGFCSLTNESIMVYNVSTTHHNEVDAGVRWNSFGFDWKIENPILSKRDKQFQKLQDFESPFVYELD